MGGSADPVLLFCRGSRAGEPPRASSGEAPLPLPMAHVDWEGIQPSGGEHPHDSCFWKKQSRSWTSLTCLTRQPVWASSQAAQRWGRSLWLFHGGSRHPPTHGSKGNAALCGAQPPRATSGAARLNFFIKGAGDPSVQRWCERGGSDCPWCTRPPTVLSGDASRFSWHSRWDARSRQILPSNWLGGSGCSHG